MAIVPNRKHPKQAPTSQVALPSPQVALYLRVSTEDQADRGTIEAQRDFLRQFASLFQLPVAGEYADDGVTGTLPLGERPEGQRLLQDAEAGAFGCVIVYRLTRLGRSLKALTEAHDRLAQFGVTIRSAQEPFDTSTPIGTFLFQLLGSLAELDRAQILEQLDRGRDRVARDGKWTNGSIPFGYTTDTQRRLTPSLREVPGLAMTEADLVRDLYERMAQGSTTVAEARRLTALGVATTRYHSNGTIREGGKKWYPGPIRKMIASTIYRGVHVLESRYGAIERQVPALVDQALWDQANAQLKLNQRLPKSNATRTYLLRGLITCGQCGTTYVGQRLWRRRGAQTIYYRCGRYRPALYARDERCHGRAINAEWLEQTVWEDCRKVIENPGEALAEAQRQLHTRMDQVTHLEQQRGSYIQALVDKGQERERVMTLYRRGRIPVATVEAQLDAIAREETELRQQCSALDAQKALAEAFEAHMTDARYLFQQLQGRLEDIDRTDDQSTKRQVIELLVHGIRVDTTEDRKFSVTITYAFIPERVACQSAHGHRSIAYSCWARHNTPLPGSGVLHGIAASGSTRGAIVEVPSLL